MNIKKEILDELNGLADRDYKAFNKKIIPTEHTTIGVRVPVLRKIAKRIAEEATVEFIECDKENIYEMIMLEGMVLSYSDKSFIELLPLTEAFLNKVDNWAEVDSTVCDFKSIKNQKEDVLKIIKKWLKYDKEFFVRAALVILLAHYVQKENLEMLFKLSQSVKHKGYYVYMANAWLISVCMAKYPSETALFLKKNNLDKRTHNKAIQKSCESFRVSEEYKIKIKQLKRS
ncbi:MAG: DNA alkylation repair protein [Deltaproteobacteria bacterium]|nr:DNA alkylation repair protein [Deltaproteobacteria bacterium]